MKALSGRTMGLEGAVVIVVLSAIVAVALTSVVFLSVTSKAAQHKPDKPTNRPNEPFLTYFNIDQYDHIANVLSNISDELRQRHERIVSTVNNDKSSTWKAKFNIFGALNNHCDQFDVPFTEPFVDAHHEGELGLEFDSRKEWPFCTFLRQPAINQGACGSCWAVAATSAMSDRICVASRGWLQPRLSAQDVLTCHPRAWNDSMLCFGGKAQFAFEMWQKDGIVTGGRYSSSDGCKPYSVNATCGGPCSINDFDRSLTCDRKCGNWYTKSYEEDRFFGKKMTVVEHSKLKHFQNAAKVQHAIKSGGPVTGFMPANEDFMHYASGVYKHVAGHFCYAHVVKIIGWGVENGIDYWLIANSWGESWGEQGFGKVAMGHFVEYVYADPIIPADVDQ